MKRLYHKLLKWGVLLIMIGLLLLTGLYVLRSVLIAPHAIAVLERRIATHLGLQVSIERLSGTYFSDLEIKNVKTLRRVSAEPISFLDLRQIKIGYHLADLFRGFPAFLAGVTIDIEGASLVIDLTTTADSDKAHETPQSVPLPPQLPQIHIRNGAVRIQGTDFETGFTGVSLTARHTDPTTSRIRLHVPEWSWNHPDLRDGSTSLDADMLYAGERLTLTKLVVGQKPLVESVTIDLDGLPIRMPFQARLEMAGGRLETSGRLDGSRLQVRLKGSSIDLSQISGLLASHITPFGGILTVRGDLELLLTNPAAMAVDLDVQISDGSLNRTTADRFAVKFMAQNGRLQINDLKLEDAANRVSIQQASVPAAVAFAGEPDALLQALMADWELECTDIPALLKLVGVALKTPGGPVPNHRLILKGRIESSQVVIADGRLETELGYVRLKSARVTLPGGDRRLADAPLAADLEADLPDLQHLSRIFALPILDGSLRARLQVTGTLDAPQGSAEFTANKVSYQNMLFGDLVVKATANTQQVTIESVVLKRDNDMATGRGSVNLAKKTLKDVQLEINVANLKPYFSQLAPLLGSKPVDTLDVSGRLAGTLNLSGPFMQPTGTVKLQTRRITMDGNHLGDADFDLKLAAEKVAVSSAEFRNSDDHVRVSGSFNHQTQRIDNVNVTLDIKNLSVYTDPWLKGNTSLSGSVSGQIQASGNLLEPDASANIQVEGFLVNDIRIEKGIVRLRNTGRQTTIELAEAKTAEGKLKIAGTIRRNPTDTEFDFRLDEAVFSHRDTVLSLEKPARIRLSRNGKVYIDHTLWSGSVGRLAVSGLFDPHAESDLLIEAADVNSDGWFERIASNRVRFQGLDAQIRIAGHRHSPSVSVTGSLDQLGSPQMPMAFSGRFDLAYSNKTATIREFIWNGAGGQQVRLTGSLPLDPFESNLLVPGRLTLTGRAEITDAAALGFLVPRYGLTGGAIESELQLDGTWAQPVGKLHLRVRNLNSPKDIKPIPPGPYDVAGDISIDGDRVTLELLEARSPDLQVRAQGQWTGAPAAADLFRFPVPTPSGQINLEGSLDAPDLSWLARQVAGVRRLAGRLEVRGKLHGSVTSPSADAIIRLSDGELSPDFDMPSLGALNLEAAITPAALKIQSLTGELGGAPFKLTGILDFGTMSESATDLRLQGENLLLFRSEDLRLRADTDLSLKGPVSRLVLSGEIAVTDGRFSKNFGVIEGFAVRGKADTSSGFQLFSIKEPPLRDMVFNVRIIAKEPFRIQNNLARGAVRPDLLLSGTGELPKLVGKVYVEPTRLYLPAGRMQMESGLIQFEPNDPDRPKLDLIGTASLLGYDITALINGPYDEPIVTLSSVPPLPDEDLLMLLLAGQPPKQSGLHNAGRKQQMNVAAFLGRDMISRIFGGESEEASEFILDRFDVEIGRRVTLRGEETINAQFRVADNVLRDGDNLYLTGERDVFDYYNVGVRIVFRFR